MIKIKIVILLIVGLGFGWTEIGILPREVNNQDPTLNKKPDYFAMEWEEGTLLTKKQTPFFIEVETMGNQSISLLMDENNRPRLYTSNITTPVCADGECRLMYLTLYWNLLGGYVGFDKVEGQALTKHDHEEFTDLDYAKLHQLLLDDNSILKRKKIDELVEKPATSETDSADATSGATIAEVKESVVYGALYSCFVAWNIAHGEIKRQLLDNTAGLFNLEMKHYMLHSNDVDYQMYALKSFEEGDFIAFKERIVEMFRESIPLIRTYIVQNLPEQFWRSDSLQIPFWESFDAIDINNRSLLLNHLETAPKEVLLSLSVNMGLMTKNQLKTYLMGVEDLVQYNSLLAKELDSFAHSKSNTYGYIVEEFLEDLE